MWKWINVLSLFDWMSCWMIALEKAWIKVNNYFASEIDKYAIQVSKKNYPSIKHIWDVQKISFIKDQKLVNWLYWEPSENPLKDTMWETNIDLLIWWSPCQWFSRAWKQLNFEDHRSKLFFEFVRILKETKPKYFLLENVKMKKEYQDIISKYLWVEPIEINSSLLSAQNRKRLYWTNIPWIEQPKDKGVILIDILEESVDKKYTFTEEKTKSLLKYRENYQVCWKTPTLTTELAHWSWKNSTPGIIREIESALLIKNATKKWYIEAEIWDWVDYSFPNSKTRRWRVKSWKSWTLVTWHNQAVVTEWKRLRKLTPIECERLQTVPDNYTEWVSETQRYKMLWNWWTTDVISHIFKHIT